jgi:hypothetical protein
MVIEGAYKELAASYAKEVRARKDLFNLVQELKGNIRVYCRVRPPNDREKADPTTREAISFPEDNTMVIANEERKASHTFDFEHIFRPVTPHHSSIIILFFMSFMLLVCYVNI